MSRYCIQTPEVKAHKKLLPKVGVIHIDNSEVVGKIMITNMRKYQFSGEVDVVFEGKAKFTVNRQKDFYDSSLLKKGVSKIKVNRIIRRYIHKEVKLRMMYFDIDVKYYHYIKKFKWI
jgi:hypothetical protein